VEAVFPAYVFIQLNLASNWRALLASLGVSRLVSFNGSPQFSAEPTKTIQR
jgi:transcriptional antiterminator RfaH